jgi:hypothetical protein
MFGWLSTLNPRTMAHTQPVACWPHIEVEPTEHPPAVERRTGISWAAMTARAKHLLQQD